MENGRDYPRDPREFDRWIKANVAIGSIFAIAILAMAAAGLNSAGQQDETTAVVSTVTVLR
jgi:hypothetical protein